MRAMIDDLLEWSISSPKQTLITVSKWPDVNVEYTTVLIRLPGGYEIRLSAADAQRLGQAINRAGGGE